MRLRPALLVVTTTAALCLEACASKRPVEAPPAVQDVVSTVDVDHFWEAYDAVRATTDAAEQLARFQALYIDRGTPGLHSFMRARHYTARGYVDAIRDYPRFWDSVRPLTARTREAVSHVEPTLKRFRALYPALGPAEVYFAVGALKSSGTALDGRVLVGAELATGDEGVDVSELPPKLRDGLGTFFKSRPHQGMDLLIAHEAVHTRQKPPADVLVDWVVYEGVADFVAEQVTGRLPPLAYVTYGPQHDAELRERFREAQDATDTFAPWLWAGADNAFGVADVGYYVGYAVARAYHAKAADKQAALRRMIELDYADTAAVKTFVRESGYLP
ncbi:DUF2268 domain-containing putative Zn-dependent protease [Corallococcus exercitus]|uniref:DUF2268 domain-containing protein n=1 Tax=Corallococcus exercitus TaxID=2316736 RepID=A0A7Y4K026_9BACT|nr:DUF2268 domain-containing putative Zn-dependent protease [Corallococcus exercitus]NOK13222.1 hypothetical protein [Corallococcus exercitus]